MHLLHVRDGGLAKQNARREMPGAFSRANSAGKYSKIENAIRIKNS